jgi:hypothetical protein
MALAAAAATADAQLDFRMNTVVDNMVGAAGDTPEASLLFSRDGGELCLTLAIPTGPTALRAPLFRFMKRVEGESRSARLKFSLPAKPQRPPGHEERLQVWEGCLPAEDDAGAAGEAMIEVHYRDPRRLKDESEYAVAYPAPESSQGVEVLKDSAGNLMFQTFQPAAGQAL